MHSKAKSTIFASTFQSTSNINITKFYLKNINLNLNPNTTTFLSKSLFPRSLNSKNLNSKLSSTTIRAHLHASLIVTHDLWVGRICIFYALLKASLAGSPMNQLVSGTTKGDQGFVVGFMNGKKNDTENQRIFTASLCHILFFPFKFLQKSKVLWSRWIFVCIFICI